VFVVQGCNVFAFHVHDFEAANLGFDKQIKRPAVFLLRGRLAAFLRMLPKEPISERRNGWRTPFMRDFFGGVLAHGDLSHDVLGQTPRLVHRDLAVPS